MDRLISTAAKMGLCTMLAAICVVAHAVDVYEPLDDGLYAVLRNGRALFLEYTPPQQGSPENDLRRLLAEPDDWETYAGKGSVAIRFEHLTPELQREALLAVFKYDYVDENGWVHQVRFADTGLGQETIWNLCEWLTGNGLDQTKVQKANGLQDLQLTRGQQLLFPTNLLLEVMRQPTPNRLPGAAEPELADLDGNGSLLSYGVDEEGRYALYRLRRGEASLYTPVVVRFTDYRDNKDILAACEVVRKRSDIQDVTKMETGQPIRIPLEMLSARFLPTESPERQDYEASLREAQRLRGQQVQARNLEGVVVILDPGHGGVDPGAEPGDSAKKKGFSLYEDEVVYDICCRIREILRTETHAQVYMTSRDRSQGFAPVNTRKFRHDEDEEVLTTPPYPSESATYSVNLRWYLANSIYRKEAAAGADRDKIVFTSVHCDALFNESLRGAMIYIPGARYRQDSERPEPDSFYDRFAEAREHREANSTSEDRPRDEALSRNFAEVLLRELGRKRVKRHDKSAPIRNVIRQRGGRAYVPAVLRNTEVPTKVLVEIANMTNRVDCQRMSDPDWRQLFAEGYVNALKAYYGS